MPEEILTIVRVPVKEVEESLREKHALPRFLSEVRVEGDTLIFCFSGELEPVMPKEPVSLVGVQRRRRARRKRNRMRTRGWEVAGRMTNSKGQPCTIYKPFVEALKDPELSHERQMAVVEKILKSNRNRPSETSILYFLENTLEYLKSHPVAAPVASDSHQQDVETNAAR
jgi:hypothetical protein